MLSFLLPIVKIQDANAKKDLETALVNDLLAGKKTALEKLYSSYAPSLLGIIFKITKEESLAEDVLQETFLKIWKSIDQFDSSKGRLFTWMARLAKNKAIDQLRSRGEINSLKNDNLDHSATEVNQLYQIEYNTEIIGLRQLVNTLSPIQTTIIDMVYFQGYTQLEVAEALNIPLGTVKTRIRTGIKAMRSLF